MNGSTRHGSADTRAPSRGWTRWASLLVGLVFLIGVALAGAQLTTPKRKPTPIDPIGSGPPDLPYPSCWVGGPVAAGSSAILDCSASQPASDGSPMTFHWSFVSRPACSSSVTFLPNDKPAGTSMSTSFTADCPGNFSVKLTLTDLMRRSNTATFNIAAVASPIKIIPPSTQIFRGQNVSLPVVINATDRSLCAVQLGIAFPTSTFSFSCSTGLAVDGNFGSACRDSLSGYAIGVASTASQSVTGNVTVLTYTVNVRTGAAHGLYQIPLVPSISLPEGRSFQAPYAVDCDGLGIGIPKIDQTLYPMPVAAMWLDFAAQEPTP